MFSMEVFILSTSHLLFFLLNQRERQLKTWARSNRTCNKILRTLWDASSGRNCFDMSPSSVLFICSTESRSHSSSLWKGEKLAGNAANNSTWSEQLSRQTRQLFLSAVNYHIQITLNSKVNPLLLCHFSSLWMQLFVFKQFINNFNLWQKTWLNLNLSFAKFSFTYGLIAKFNLFFY